MKPSCSIDSRVMPEQDLRLQRKTNLITAWFVRLDKEKRNLLSSGRFRLLLLSLAILTLLLLNLLGVIDPQSRISVSLNSCAASFSARLCQNSLTAAESWIRRSNNGSSINAASRASAIFAYEYSYLAMNVPGDMSRHSLFVWGLNGMRLATLFT